jgi:hypothetical protein
LCSSREEPPHPLVTVTGSTGFHGPPPILRDCNHEYD